jgi:site-specific DNA recombinase
MRAAIYTRVSTDDQAEHGVSMEAQEADCNEHARLLGATSIDVYRDPGYSASTMDRPALRELLSRLREYNVLVVWRTDRLTRSLEHLLLIMRLCQEAGVTVDGVRESIKWQTADDQFILHLQGALAERERRVAAERVARGMRQVASTGRWPGRASLGYRFADKRLVVDETEAAIVRDVFRRYLDGESIRGIASQLRDEGMTGPNGGQIARAHIRTMLTNRIYVGEMRWSGEVHDADHEAIIDRETWDAVQERLALRAKVGVVVRPYERKADGRKLAGHTRRRLANTIAPIMRCGYCGAQMCKGRGSGRMEYYRCSGNTLLPAESRHENGHIPRVKVDAVLWRHVELDITEGALRQAAQRIEEQRAESGGRRAQLLARLAEVEAQLKRAVELVQRGMPLDVVTAANAPLVAEREELRAQLDADAPPPEVHAWRKLRGHSVIERVRAQDAETQLAFLFSIYDRVVLWHDEVEFHYVGNACPPARRALPRYYAPNRGRADVGF